MRWVSHGIAAQLREQRIGLRGVAANAGSNAISASGSSSGSRGIADASTAIRPTRRKPRRSPCYPIRRARRANSSTAAPMTEPAIDRIERDVMEYDVVTVGAGPAGLAFAIRLKQLKPEISVCVIEKASTIGAHILSGAVIEPARSTPCCPTGARAPPPICVPAGEDEFWLLTQDRRSTGCRCRRG